MINLNIAHCYRRTGHWVIRFTDGTRTIVPISGKRGRKSGPRQLSDPDRARLANMITARRTIRQIAVAFDTSTTTAIRWIRAYGLRDVWDMYKHSSGIDGIARTNADDLRAFVACGATLQEAGDRLGVSRERVRQVLEKYHCNAPRMQTRRMRSNAAYMARWEASETGKVMLDFIARAEAAGYSVVRSIKRTSNGTRLGVAVFVNRIPTRVAWCRSPRIGCYYGAWTRGDKIIIFAMPHGERAAFWPPHLQKFTYIRLAPYVYPADKRNHPRRPPPRMRWNAAVVGHSE